MPEPLALFLDREQEINDLTDAFLNKVIKQHRCAAFLITGRTGIGKTKLIHEFMAKIESDEKLAFHVPHFRRYKHAIEYLCQEKGGVEPYLAFIDLKKKMEQQQKHFKLFQLIFMLLISVLPIHDLVDDLNRLVEEMKTNASSEGVRRKELRIFSRYRNFLQKMSRTNPIILYIQNVQWIDEHSFNLLQSLIEDDQSLWGMIIMEQEGVYHTNPRMSSILSDLVRKGALNHTNVRPLRKGFEIEILEHRFQKHLFTPKELDYIYTLSEGLPGALSDYAEGWLARGWITEQPSMGVGSRQWKKVEDFENRIKPPYEKMLDLVINALQDGTINAREQRLIDNMARELGIDQCSVSGMIAIVREAREAGYEIVTRLHKGSFSDNAFLAQDRNSKRYVVEYVGNGSVGSKDLAPIELSHKGLLLPLDVVGTPGGVLLVFEQYKGETIRENLDKAQHIYVDNVLRYASQIGEALGELHRNGLVHRCLHPNSIVVTEDGRALLSSASAALLPRRISGPGRLDEEFLSCISPEQIQGGVPDSRSDIFSFGAVVYQLLVNEPPFQGTTREGIEESVLHKSPFEKDRRAAKLSSEVRSFIEKCLAKAPQDRFQSMDEVLKGLKELLEPKPSTVPGPVEPVKSRRAWKALAAVILLAIAIGIVAYCVLGRKTVVAGSVVVDHFKILSSPGAEGSLTAEMVRFLVSRSLAQACSRYVFSPEEFQYRYQEEGAEPDVRVTANISVRKVGYRIEVDLVQRGSTEHIELDLVDPSQLLQEGLTEIDQKVAHRIGVIAPQPARSVSGSWNAFEEFYKGESLWDKLDIQAEPHFVAALNFDQRFALAKLRLAEICDFTSRSGDALRYLTEVDEQNRRDPLILSQLDKLKSAALRARLGNRIFDEIDALQGIYTLYPTRRESAYELAEAYYRICDVSRAAEYYRRALDLDPNYSLAHNHLGYCYTHLGDHEKALEHFQRYVALDGTANAYDSLGDGLMAAGRLDEAAAAKEQGLLKDRQLYYLWGSLGYVHLRQGKFQEAENDFNSFIKFASGDGSKADGKFRLALIAYARGDYPGALALCLQGMQYDVTAAGIVGRRNELHWLLGFVYLRLGQMANAEREIRDAEALIQNEKINATNYRKGIYKYYLHLQACKAAQQGNMEELQRIITEFNGPIKDKINDNGSPFDLAFFNTSFAELLMDPPLRRLDLAEQRLDVALKYNPNYAPAHYKLGSLYLAQGRNGEAENHLSIFKKLWIGPIDVKTLPLF
jgi:tetratricopeptide (TPR) repeat protein